MSFIKTIIAGFVGAAPKVTMVNQTKKATFSVAVNTLVSSKENKEEKEQKTEWVQIEFWGKNAEKAEASLSKGTKVEIEGKFKANAYLDKDNKPQVFTYLTGYKLEIIEKQEEVPA